MRAGDVQFPVRQLDFSTRSGHGGENIITAVRLAILSASSPICPLSTISAGEPLLRSSQAWKSCILTSANLRHARNVISWK